MPRDGFNNQWIEISRAGRFRDANGVERNLTRDMFDQVIANFEHSTSPIVVGHPENDTAPAYGWASELRLNGDSLEARFSDTDPNFEQLVAAGRFKKRSASFYLEPPRLRHVGFLGATPPAIKGLRDIQFAEGESFAVESTINFKETDMGLKDEDIDQLPESFWAKFKTKLGLGTADLSEGKQPAAAAPPANFSEAELKGLIAEAITSVTAEFKQQVEALEQANTELRSRVNDTVAGSAKAEIASFVESIPAEKGKHFLKRIGIADFLERLAQDDASDENSPQAISFSEGDGDDKETHEFSRLGFAKELINALPNHVEFGEKFGGLTAVKDPDPLINSDRVKEMKAAAGVADGGEK
ncbi:MAG: hypothetical protein IPM50_09260 [Acidobacteriota bacterium]|nr:MAG: hypothetical protein IPM50_09260 [Acidobacteriota bacterium]